MASPSNRRATKHRRSSITELAFHGIHTSRQKAKSVTHVSGTKCHLCLRPHTEAWLTAKRGQEARASSTTAQREALHRQIAEGLRRTCDPQLRHSPFLLGSLHAALVMLLGAAIAREIIA